MKTNGYQYKIPMEKATSVLAKYAAEIKYQRWKELQGNSRRKEQRVNINGRSNKKKKKVRGRYQKTTKETQT